MNKEEILDVLQYLDDLLVTTLNDSLKSCLAEPFTESEALRYAKVIPDIERAGRITSKLLDEKKIWENWEDLLDESRIE